MLRKTREMELGCSWVPLFLKAAAQQQMAERITRHFVPFKKGEKVWLEARNLNLGIPHRKLKPKREGPFEITKVLSPWTYQLQLPPQWKIHPVFHAGLLTPYKTTKEHGPDYLRPPPDIVDGEEEQEVEAILNHRSRGRTKKRWEYLVAWTGMESAENSWEPESHLKNAPEILNRYKRRHKLS